MEGESPTLSLSSHNSRQLLKSVNVLKLLGIFLGGTFSIPEA